MTYAKKFDENRVKLIKAFRAKVSGGQSASRVELIALAFLRERPYVALEAKINEDHPSFGFGRSTFLSGLSYQIQWAIKSLKVEGLDSTYTLPESKDILNWMMEKYQTVQLKTEEKAA